jgi:hypothetical protein
VWQVDVYLCVSVLVNCGFQLAWIEDVQHTVAMSARVSKLRGKHAVNVGSSVQWTGGPDGMTEQKGKSCHACDPNRAAVFLCPLMDIRLQVLQPLKVDLCQWDFQAFNLGHPNCTMGLFLLRQSCFVAQISLELAIFLPQPPECWDYRCAPPCPAYWPLFPRLPTFRLGNHLFSWFSSPQTGTVWLSRLFSWKQI